MFYKWLIFFCLLPFYLAAQESLAPIQYQENGLWGLKEDKPITPAVYDTLIPIKNSSYFIAKKHKSRAYVNSTGVISSKGKSIIPFDYLDITVAGSNYVVKRWENGTVKVGAISRSNNTILNVRFKSVQPLNDFWVAKSFTDELNLYYADGSLYKQLLIDSISFSPDPQFMYTYRWGKVGLINNMGEQSYPPTYKSINYENGRWETTLFNQWKIISDTDSITIYADSVFIWDSETRVLGINNKYQIASIHDRVGETYDAISIVSPSFAITKKSSLVGAVNKNGTEVLRPQFNNIYYEKGYFYTYKNNNWSLYDSLGNKKSILKYDSIGSVNDGLFPILRKGKWGFMNRSGKEVIHCIYDTKAQFNNGKAIIKYYGAMGIINLEGNWIVKPNYKNITGYSFNFYIYKIYNLYYLKNYKGDLIYFSPHTLVFKGETIYEIRNQAKSEISSLGTKVKISSSIAKGINYWDIIKIGEKYGFVDSDGLLKITYRYDSLLPYTEGLAAFKLRGKWGFINSKEEIIIQPIYSSVTPFNNKTAVVSQFNKKGLINSTGKYILKPKFDSISLLKNNIWLVTKDKLAGLFDSNGKVILQNKYDQIDYIHDNLIIISRKNAYGAVNIKGVSVLPRVYSFIGFDYQNNLLLLKKEN